MIWSPTPRLLAAVAAWCGVCLASLQLPVPDVALALLPALLAGLVAADWAWSRRDPPHAIERRLPARAHVGGGFPVEIVVRNPGGRRLSVAVWEAVPPDLDASRETFAVSVAAGEEAVLAYRVRPTRRGDRTLGRAVAFAVSALGLLRRRVEGSANDVLRIYPDASLLLRREALDPRRVLELVGARPAPRLGEGVEFESMRDYVPGDDPRRVDWAATARRGRPVVRQYQHERNHPVCVVLDGSRLMAAELAGRSKLDHAVDAALVLAYAALVTGDRVSMLAFDREVRGFLAPRSHRRDLGSFLDFLRPLETRPVEADFGALARHLAVRQRQRALVVVLTDFLEGEPALVHPLAVLSRRHELLLVAIRDPIFEELGPGAGPTGDPYRRIVLGDLLRDRETTLAGLRRLGMHTLDLPPRQITGAVLNRYLAIRGSLHGARRASAGPVAAGPRVGSRP